LDEWAKHKRRPHLHGKVVDFLGQYFLFWSKSQLSGQTKHKLCTKCSGHWVLRAGPGPPWDWRRGFFFSGACHTYPHLDEIHVLHWHSQSKNLKPWTVITWVGVGNLGSSHMSKNSELGLELWLAQHPYYECVSYEDTALSFPSTTELESSFLEECEVMQIPKKLLFRFHSPSQKDWNLGLTCDFPRKSPFYPTYDFVYCVLCCMSDYIYFVDWKLYDIDIVCWNPKLKSLTPNHFS
jgi:hypothetical protein